MTATAAAELTGTPRRVIAKARHTRPDGTRCRGVASAVQQSARVPADEPGFSYHRQTADGQLVPQPRDTRDIDADQDGWVALAANGSILCYVGPCPDCGQRKIMRGEQVRGRYSAQRDCDPRCTGARGVDCECHCAGANHGAAHSL